MERYSDTEQTRVVQLFFELKSLISIQRTLKNEGRRDIPSRWTIMWIVEQFNETGNVQRKPYQQDWTARTTNNIASVAAAIQNDPTISTKQLALDVDVSPRNVSPILHKALNLFPYTIQLAHSLNPEDLPIRLEYCRTLLQFA